MTAADFPNSPSDGQLYTVDGITRRYSASDSKWSIIPQTIAGPVGATGAQGTTGNVGGLLYNIIDITEYSSDPFPTPPASGYIQIFDYTFLSTTDIGISSITLDGTDVGNYLATFDDSTSSPVKGHLIIQNNNTVDGGYLIYSITSISPDTGGYLITGTLVSGSGIVSGDDVVISFLRTGDKGVQGTQGIQGPQGLQGRQGTQGIQGPQGTQGIQGPQGTQGIQGHQGTQGITGGSFDNTTSTTSVTIGTGSKGPFSTTNTGAYVVGQRVRVISTATPTNFMEGDITALTANTSITVNVTNISGSGTIASWRFAVAGLQGVQGTQGPQGTQGIQGPQGTQGIQGPQGTQGIQGPQGTQGIQGPQGTQGIQGPQADTTLPVIAAKSASHTLVLSDAGDLVPVSSASNLFITIPTNATVAFLQGTQVNILRQGTGTVSIQGATGVSVQGTPGLQLRAQYSLATAIKLGTDHWLVTGDLIV